MNRLIVVLVLSFFMMPSAVTALDRLDQLTVDELFAVLNAYPDEQQRVLAARWIGFRVERPTPEQARYLASASRSDKSPSVRAATASAIGKIGTRKIYRTGSRRLPYEVKVMLEGLRQSYLYEAISFVRIPIVEAVSEYDHNMAQVIISLAKGDIDQEVHDAAYAAERRREERLRSSGLGWLATRIAFHRSKDRTRHIGVREEKLSPNDAPTGLRRIVPAPELRGGPNPRTPKERIACVAKVYTQFCYNIPSYPRQERICYWRQESVSGTWNKEKECCEVFSSDGFRYCMKDGVVLPISEENK